MRKRASVEIEFDDLSVPIQSDVYAGSYSGIAEIDNSGSVVALTIHGYDAAGKPADIYVQRKFSGWKTTAENFADEVGQRVEPVCRAHRRGVIRLALQLRNPGI